MKPFVYKVRDFGLLLLSFEQMVSANGEANHGEIGFSIRRDEVGWMKNGSAPSLSYL